MKLVGCHGVTESARFSRERCVNFYVTPGASGGIADASLIDAWRHQRSCHTVPPSLSSQRWDARISSSGGFQTRNTNNQKRASSSNEAKFARLADDDIAARCWVYSLLSLLDDLPIVTHNRRLGREKQRKTQGSRLDWPSYSYSLYVPERSCHWASESPGPRRHWPHFMQLIWKKRSHSCHLTSSVWSWRHLRGSCCRRTGLPSLSVCGRRSVQPANQEVHLESHTQNYECC